jgi:hypothetical protein
LRRPLHRRPFVEDIDHECIGRSASGADFASFSVEPVLRAPAEMDMRPCARLRAPPRAAERPIAPLPPKMTAVLPCINMTASSIRHLLHAS